MRLRGPSSDLAGVHPSFCWSADPATRSPKVVIAFNGRDVMVVNVQGYFNWNSHPDTDDFFLVLKGEVTIQMRDKDDSFREGELYVVPKGVEHRPFAAGEAHILMIEPKGTPNTGKGSTADAKESL